mmetsp:Transcript_50342/g.156005  ORF Transcript_50342/g.156005 Transcript_50342/m.156005 type:complete len:328 (-) Transcript_50342:213-1196(-)
MPMLGSFRPCAEQSSVSSFAPLPGAAHRRPSTTWTACSSRCSPWTCPHCWSCSPTSRIASRPSSSPTSSTSSTSQAACRWRWSSATAPRSPRATGTSWPTRRSCAPDRARRSDMPSTTFARGDRKRPRGSWKPRRRTTARRRRPMRTWRMPWSSSRTWTWPRGWARGGAGSAPRRCAGGATWPGASAGPAAPRSAAPRRGASASPSCWTAWRGTTWRASWPSSRRRNSTSPWRSTRPPHSWRCWRAAVRPRPRGRAPAGCTFSRSWRAAARCAWRGGPRAATRLRSCACSPRAPCRPPWQRPCSRSCCQSCPRREMKLLWGPRRCSS